MQTQPVLRPVERLADMELVASILAGDMHALEALMRLHNRTLYRTARAILRDEAEAEDAVQEAYLQAFRALGRFRGESKLSIWLVRITAKEALMRRRRNARAATAAAPDLEPDSLESDEAGPQSDAQRGDMRLLEARIDAMPRYLSGGVHAARARELSVEETAGVLGIPEATVRTRYSGRGLRCDRIVREVFAKLQV